MTGRKAALHLLAGCALAGLVWSACAQGQMQPPYPARPIRLVLPFGPGTSSDSVVRALASRLGEQMKTPVVVENREGAGGRIGAASVATAPADGYTLLFAVQPPFVVAPLLQKRPAYDAVADFTPVARIASVPMVLVSSPKAPFSTFAQMVEHAKKNPGKVDYASAGIGVPSHLFMEQFKQTLGLHITFIPYRATGQMYADVIAGHVPLAMLALGAARPYVHSGELRGLAIGAPRRHPFMENVPTLQEATGRREFGDSISIWFGVLGPPGMPADVVARLNAEITAAAQSPLVKAALEAQGATPTPATAAELATELAATKRASQKLVEDLRIGGME